MIRFLILLTFATPAFAAPVPKSEGVKPEHFTEHRILLLRSSAVQKELGLSAEQRIAVIDGFETVDSVYSEGLHRIYPPSRPPETEEESVENRKRLSEIAAKRTAASQDLLASVLKPAQVVRLMELERHYLGPFAFRDPSVAAELKLSPEQMRVIDKAFADFSEAYIDEFGPRKKPSGRSVLEASKSVMEAITKELTVDQQARWKELLGKEPKLATTGIAAARHLIAAVAKKAYPHAKDD